MVPWLPVNTRAPDGAAVNRTWLVALPRGVTLPVPPTKLTVAPALRVRPAKVSADVAPEAAAAVKPDTTVDSPRPRVRVPTVSLEAVLAVLLATKLKVPPLSVRAAASARRLRLTLAELSSRSVPVGLTTRAVERTAPLAPPRARVPPLTVVLPV